jgi:hypothetical protein
MKKFVMCLLLSILVVTPAFAVEQDITISKEALLVMSDAQRNAIFDGIKKQEQLKETTLDKDSVKIIADMDVEVFKSKAMAIADTIVVFCDKLGVSVNQFITTPVGAFTTIGVMYKLGIFSSIWSSIGSIIVILFFSILLYKFNTKKIVKLKSYNSKNEVTDTQEVLVPSFSAVQTTDKEAQSAYTVIGSAICIIVIIGFFIKMF